MLVDLEMPWVEGISFLERLRADARFAATRVVGVSGEPGPLLLGVVERLRKPVTLAALLTSVNRHCPRRETPNSSGSSEPGTQVG